MKVFFPLCLMMAFSSLLFAQNDPCTCAENVERMYQKLEANYIAYHLTKDKIGASYQTRKLQYRVLAAKTPLNGCAKLMQAFLSFFKDGHLFVSEFPKLPEAELSASKTMIKAQKVDLQKVNPGNKTGIEGYWTDGTSKFAIIKNNNPKVPFSHVAVVLEAPDSSKAGEVKMGVSLSNGLWEGLHYTNAYTPRYVKITPYKDNQLLSIWGGFTWGKLLDKNAPLFDPTLPSVKKLDDQTVLLTIPSFLIDKKQFDAVLMGNFKELTESEYLIIDIRGNTGGNGIYLDLLRLYYEKPALSQVGFAISSADNLDYFKKFASTRSNDPYAPVVAAMQAETGKIVSGPVFGPLEQKPLPSKLKKVVILTDRGNMSAAETFILHSKGVSSKVVTMGENTGGVVDYNNINMVSLGCETQGIFFGYPTYSLNDAVHLGKGYNKTGIAPDVRIDAKIVDKIGFARQYLQKR